MLSRCSVPVISLVLLAALAVACDNAGGGDQAEETLTGAPTASEGATTATISPEATATATATPASAPQSIREVDLTAQPGLRDFLASSGGQVLPGEIIYADFTGDGLEEAAVHVWSGGTLGNLAVFVYGYVDGELRELLRELPPAEALGGHIRAMVEAGQLVIAWGIYGPDDPNCCPSGGYRTRYYRWDGRALVVAREEVRPPGEGP